MIGRVISNYKIVSEIGYGGMGVVYKAHDLSLDRLVAIKVLRADNTKTFQFIQRFKREAKNQAALSHQNIVPVYGFIEENGMLGIIMEYVEGETLQNLIERKIKLDIFESIFLIKQVLKGVEYAHSRGLIHRDIKPSNIIISTDGTVKIMDFGISRSISEKHITQTGKHVGSLHYMSPEQIKGSEPTIESDIYSIGITLFEMLTGKVPYDYETEYDVINGHLKEALPDILQLSPEIPEQITSILPRALNKNPKNRYSSLHEFYTEVENLENELNVYFSKKPIERKTRSKSYKIKAIIYSALILLTGFSLIYFIFAQVLEYWKSGDTFLKTIVVKDPVDTKPSKALRKFECEFLKSGTKQNLNSIFFTDDYNGFACGDSGILLKTTNAGSTWEILPLAVSENLFDVHFNGNGNVILIGEKSILLKSSDFGKTWNNLNLLTKESFFRIKFFNEFTGFILGAGGAIFKTTDAGSNWYKVPSDSKVILYDLDFRDAHNLFIVGWNGEILRSIDSGENWLKQESFSKNYLKSIKFSSPSIGFISGGNGDLFKTIDGGKSWQKIKINNNDPLLDINFINNEIGFATGGKGKIFTTYDEGRNWSLSEISSFTSLNRITVTPSKKVFAVGVNGTIIKF